MTHVAVARSKRSLGAQTLVAWASYIAATSQALSLGLLLGIVQQGKFSQFDCSRLLLFVPSHLLLWRSTWCSFAFATLALLFVFIGLRQCIDRRFNALTTFVLALAIIATTSSINADASVLIMFSDLAQELNLNYSLNHLGTVHLSWATVSQFLSQELIIANGLFSIAGILLALVAFSSRAVPKIVAWGGLFAWLVSVNATAVTAAGNVDWGMLIYALGKVCVIAWLALTGASFTIMKGKLQKLQENSPVEESVPTPIEKP